MPAHLACSAHVALLEPVQSGSAPCSSSRSALFRPFKHPAANPQRRVRSAAKRKGKGAGGGGGAAGGLKGSSKGPGLVEIEPDGSDLWRLDAVTDCLRQGGVSLCFQGQA